MSTDYQHLFIIIWMLVGIYVLVLFAVMADLWSGVRKARRLKNVRTSEGYKRTIGKLGKYYNTLFALTIIDAMQCVGVWYLDNFYGYKIPILPIFSLVGAIGIGLIEIKSIYENREDKSEIDNIAKLASKLYENKDSVEKMTSAFMDFLNTSQKNEGINKKRI